MSSELTAPHRVRRPGPAVEERDLAEYLAGLDGVEHHFLAARRAGADPDTPGHHAVKRVPGVSLGKQDLAGGQLPGHRHIGDLFDDLVRQVAEQGIGGQQFANAGARHCFRSSPHAPFTGPVSL